MSPRKIMRDLSDTAFSSPRLIIWTLGIESLLCLIFIGALAFTGKEIPPSLTLAFGVVTTTFSNKVKKG